MHSYFQLDNYINIPAKQHYDKSFERFLELCFHHATAFSLRRDSFRTPAYPSCLEEQLHPYLIDSYETVQWFAYSVRGGTLTELLYHAVPETLALLKENYPDVFGRNRRYPNMTIQKQIGQEMFFPSILEDLCFFQGHDMFIGTVSHELICVAKCLNEDFKQDLFNITPYWTECQDMFWMSETKI